jgi:hypothetical protein
VTCNLRGGQRSHSLAHQKTIGPRSPEGTFLCCPKWGLFSLFYVITKESKSDGLYFSATAVITGRKGWCGGRFLRVEPYDITLSFVVSADLRCVLQCAVCCTLKLGRDSLVGIATRYRLDGQRFESRWGEIFRSRPDRPWAHPASCRMGTGSLSWEQSGRGVALTRRPHLTPR